MLQSILSDLDYKNKHIQHSINLLNAEMDDYRDSVIPKLKSYFCSNSFDNITQLISSIGHDRFLYIFSFVLKKRTLSTDEMFDKSLIDFISHKHDFFSDKKNQQLLFSSFNNLDRLDKIKFCLNYGYSNYISDFFFCKNFLKSELSVGKQKGKTNQLYIEGFYFDQKCPSLTVSFVKDSLSNIDTFAKSLTTIFNNEYPANIIQIFEHTLSEFENYVIKVENGRVFVPIRYSSDLFSSSTGDMFTDFVNVLTFISKNLWYQE